MSVLFVLLLLLPVSFAAPLIAQFSISRCIFGILVYIFALKISLYCTLVNSIKARFHTMKSKYLCEENNSKSSVEIETTKLILTESVWKVSRLEEISMIYDEMLQIISLLNESFSTLLSSAFSKY